MGEEFCKDPEQLYQNYYRSAGCTDDHDGHRVHWEGALLNSLPPWTGMAQYTPDSIQPVKYIQLKCTLYACG